MVRSGLDFAKLASQLDGVNGFDGGFRAQQIGHGVARIPHRVYSILTDADMSSFGPLDGQRILNPRERLIEMGRTGPDRVEWYVV
jgi:hypothetical protein